MTEEQYLLLCEKYLKGQCTSTEETALMKYQSESGITSQKWQPATMGDSERTRLTLAGKLHKSLHPKKRNFITQYKWQSGIAATLLVFVSVAIYLFTMPKTGILYTMAVGNKPQVTQDILPAANKAILTLAGGKQIVLNSNINGVLSKHTGSSISKRGNDLVVESDGKAEELDADALNTVMIPRGGKFNINLPDGTKVWLNAASSISFPTAFTRRERRINLTGEAYFEVTKDKSKPFIINVAGKQEIEVLGTHFNVNAYSDEKYIYTTLLEGSVKVSFKNKTAIIKQGEVAVNDLDNEIIVKQADVAEVMAWKNGMFLFNNENIASIMRKVSRWYDVDIEYKGDMANVNIDGNYSRNKSLKSLLKNIEIMDKVNFKIKERRVTIIGK